MKYWTIHSDLLTFFSCFFSSIHSTLRMLVVFFLAMLWLWSCHCCIVSQVLHLKGIPRPQSSSVSSSGFYDSGPGPCELLQAESGITLTDDSKGLVSLLRDALCSWMEGLHIMHGAEGGKKGLSQTFDPWWTSPDTHTQTQTHMRTVTL